jgi:y4mF family transcriptional regulator
MHVTTLNDLAATVRGTRTDLGLTQQHLADRAGVSRKSVNELELGKTAPAFGSLLRVIHALGLQLTIAHPETGQAAERPTNGGAAPDLDDLLKGYADDA